MKEEGGVKYHLHLEEDNTESVKNQVYFRDYLLKHPVSVKKYFELKKDWAKQAGDDWAQYSFLKSGFVRNIVRKQESLLKESCLGQT